MAEKVTYESLQEDTDFLNNAYFFLKDMGERVSSDPKDILDTFIEKRRAFDTNIFSTYSQGTDIAEASNAVKLNYRAAIDKLDQMPDFYEKGGAPTGGALFDYVYYGATDPTNLLSILAGAFTLPAGGTGAAGVFGAKQAATAGIREAMKAKLKASISKPVLKAMALEGTIAGAGGATQGVLSQETDMDIGRREKGDYDYTNIALQGLLEGTLSPVAGIGLNLSGTFGKEVARKIPKGVEKIPSTFLTPSGKTINDSARWGTQWLKRNFLPPPSQDAQIQRLYELLTEKFKPILERTEKNSKLIHAAHKNFSQNVGEVVSRDITNDLLDGNDIDIGARLQSKRNELDTINREITDKKDINYDRRFDPNINEPEEINLIKQNIQREIDKLEVYKQREDAGLYKDFREANEGIDDAIDSFRADIKELQAEGSASEANPYISNFLDDTYFKTDKYMRDIYEKFHTAREDFDKFIARPENSNIIQDYMNLIEADPTLAKDLGIKVVDDKGNLVYAKQYLNKDGSLNKEILEKRTRQEVEELYKPVLNKTAKYGATYKLKDVPPVVQQIFGKNFSPAVRMMETTQGIINTITDLRMYGSLVDNTLARQDPNNPFMVRADNAKNARIEAVRIRKEFYENQGKSSEEATRLAEQDVGDFTVLATEYNVQKNAEPVYNNDGTRIDYYDHDLSNPEAVFVIPGRMRSEEYGGNKQIEGNFNSNTQSQIIQLERERLKLSEGEAPLDIDVRTQYHIRQGESPVKARELAQEELDFMASPGVLLDATDTTAVKRFAYDKKTGEIKIDPITKRPVEYKVNPLTGKPLPTDVNTSQFYIRSDIAKNFKEMFNHNDFMTSGTGKLSVDNRLLPVLNFFSEMQGYLKKGKTVYNPIAIVRNILGAGGYMVNSGNYSGLARLANLYVTGTKEQRKLLMEQAQRLGLKGSQIEINQILNRIGKKQIGIKGGSKEVLRRLATGQVLGLLEGTRFDKELIKLYGRTDDLGKLGTWMSEVVTQEKIWKNMNDADRDILRKEFIDSRLAQNSFKTKKEYEDVLKALEAKNNQSPVMLNKAQEDLLEKFDDALIKEIAAQKTLDVVPVYSRIPKILEKIRGIPIVGNFAAFPAENLRNKYKLFQIAGDEIRTGFEKGNMALVRAGTRRLLAQSAYAAAPATIAYFYNQMEGTSEAANAIREGLMDYQKDHAIAVRKGKDGKFYYTDLSYSNTDAAVLDIITPFLAAGARGEADMNKVLTEIFPRAAWNYLSSFMEPSLATNVVQDFVSYAQAPTDEERGSILARIGKTMTPGVLKSIAEISADLGAFSENETLSSLERTFRPLFYGEDRKRFEDSADLASWLAKHNLNVQGFGDAGSLKDIATGTALASFGIVSGEKEFNPRKTFAYISRNLQKNVLEDLQKTKQEMIAKIGDPTLVYNRENLLKEYNELFEEQFVGQQGIAKLIGLYSNILPSNQLQSIIRDPAIKGSLSKKQIGNINKNKFYPEDLSKDFVEKIRQAYVKAYGKGKVPQEEFNSIISDMRRLHNLWRFKPLDIEDPEGQVEAQQ